MIVTRVLWAHMNLEVAVGHGWEPIFDELDALRRGRLLAFATMLAGPSQADDLVQDAVIATFSRRRGFADVAQAESYVRRAIATKYIDLVRRNTTAANYERHSASAGTLADHAESVATGDALDAALSQLPARVRACVMLRYLEDLSVRETAHALGLSEGAVKRYVSDGLKLLNANLGLDEKPEDLRTTPVTTKNGGTR